MKSFAQSFRLSGWAALLATVAGSLVIGSAHLYAQEHPDIPLAGPAFLPNPSGSQVVAGWLAVDRAQVWNETNNRYQLSYTGPWGASLAAPFAANYANGGNFALTVTNGPSVNYMGDSSIYTMMSANTNLSIATEDYSGPAFSRLILQFTINFMGEGDVTRDSLDALNPTLFIGAGSFGKDEAIFSRDRAFTDDYATTDPLSRYSGHNGGLSLVTLEWDLDALGYTGDLSEFSVQWTLQAQHSTIYDAQLSVAPIPEPSTWALLGLAGVVGLILKRKRSGSALA